MSDLDRLEGQLKEVHESQLFVEMDKRDAADLIARVKSAENLLNLVAGVAASSIPDMTLRDKPMAAVVDLSVTLTKAEAERDAYKERLDAVRGLADEVANLHVGKISTHSAGCHTWHIECMAARVIDAIDGDPTG